MPRSISIIDAALSEPRLETTAVTGTAAVPPRVVMLVRNVGTFDTRVRKEAVALRSSGYQVFVVALRGPGVPDEEEIDGVGYIRVQHAPHLLYFARDAYLAAQTRRRETYRLRVEAGRQRRHRRARRLRALPGRSDPGAGPDPSGAESPAPGASASAQADSPVQHLPQPARQDLRSTLGSALGGAVRRRVVRLRRLAKKRVTLAVRRGERGLALGYQRSTRLHHSTLSRAWTGFRRAYRAAEPAMSHREYAATVTPALERLAPDLVHAHDLNTLWAARRYAQRRRIPLVYDSHELELHRNTTWTPLKRAVARVVETLGVRSASAVITVSPSIAADLARTYYIPLPAVVLNAPPREAAVASAPVDLKDSAGLSGKEKLVVYVGAVLHGRGLEQLVEALPFSPSSLHIGILGPRRPDREEPLVRRAQADGTADRVHIFDPLPAALVPAALATADASVSPVQNVCRSYDLALPNKLFDAVMAGVPVGVGELQEMSRFVRENEVGVVFDERDPKAIAAALGELIGELPAGLRDLDRLEDLRAQVCWERQVEVLLALYRGLLPLPSDPAAGDLDRKAKATSG